MRRVEGEKGSTAVCALTGCFPPQVDAGLLFCAGITKRLKGKYLEGDSHHWQQLLFRSSCFSQRWCTWKGV